MTAFDEVWGPINSPNDVFQKAWALLKSMDPDRPPVFRSRENPWIEDWADIISFDPEQIKHDNQLERHPAVQILKDISDYYMILKAMGKMAAGEDMGPWHQNMDEIQREFTGDFKPGSDAFRTAIDEANKFIKHNQKDLQDSWSSYFHVTSRHGLDLDYGFKMWDPTYHDAGAVMRERFGEEIAQQAGAKAAPPMGSTMSKDLVSGFIRQHGWHTGPRPKYVERTETDEEGKEYTVQSDDWSDGGKWEPDEILYFPPPKEYDHGAHVDVVNGHRRRFGIEGVTIVRDRAETPGRAFRDPGAGGNPRFNISTRPTLDDVATGIRGKLEAGARYSQDNWWEEAYPHNPELWWPNLTLDHLRNMYHDYHEGIYDNHVAWDHETNEPIPGGEEDTMHEYLTAYPWLHPDTNLDNFDAYDHTTYAGMDEHPLTTNKEHFKDLYEHELHPGTNVMNAKLHQAFLDRMDNHAFQNINRQRLGEMI